METLYKFTNELTGIKFPDTYYIWAKNKDEAHKKFKNFYRGYNELYGDMKYFKCVAVYDINNEKVRKEK